MVLESSLCFALGILLAWFTVTLFRRDHSGGSKFVRVVGSGRGTGAKRSGAANVKKRAAITTHTSLDGSQADWDNDSQLPNTEPDSGENLTDNRWTVSVCFP